MDAPSPSGIFLFEGFRLDLRNGGLFRCSDDGAYVPVGIGSRALEVLGLLIERQGDLVSRDEIMSAVWPGTTVEEANLTVQISALRRVIDSGRQGQSCIQTVPGRGYRFVLSVTRTEADDAVTSAGPTVQQATTCPAAMPARGLSRFWGWRPAVALSVVALAVLLTTLWPVPTRAPPHLSLVVLPFENLSGDRSEDYLADAITDDLTTELSSVPGMFVVARESAYTYRRKPASVRVIGGELGVRYLVEGSERKLGDVIHVNARLVSTQTGGQLWAASFDEPVRDLNAGQMQIARWIGETLHVAVIDEESARSRRERPTNPDAFDLIIRARSIWLHPMGERENAKNIGLYEQALRLDPTSVLAMTGLAEALLRAFTSADARDRATQLIDAAATADPDNHGVLATTGYLLFRQGRFAEAISAYQRVLEEYPNSFYAYNQIGICLIETGRAEEAIPFIHTAIANDPRSPFNWDRYGNLGFALLLLGRDEESIVWTRRALAANLNLVPWIRAQYNLRLAAAYARLGNFEQAHRAIGEADRIWPYDTVRSHWPETPSNVVYVAQIERFQAALRLAGHRDHANEDADFGITANDTLDSGFTGPTPRIAPGAVTIRTPDLDRLLAVVKPIVIDAMSNSWGRSIPGAIGLADVGLGGATTDGMQKRLRATMHELTGGDLSRPVVAVGWNSESFDGRNLALRLVALGYRQVYWYRGGREAWEVAGLPETRVTPRDW